MVKPSPGSVQGVAQPGADAMTHGPEGAADPWRGDLSRTLQKPGRATTRGLCPCPTHPSIAKSPSCSIHTACCSRCGAGGRWRYRWRAPCTSTLPRRGATRSASPLRAPPSSRPSGPGGAAAGSRGWRAPPTLARGSQPRGALSVSCFSCGDDAYAAAAVPVAAVCRARLVARPAHRSPPHLLLATAPGPLAPRRACMVGGGSRPEAA